ncbi:MULTISPECIES: hypothetical protein [Cyanophyceae]|uniref:hypothetical protein n=1 Tax=Cyanophyceae TaxID=3028117 RepID=UPI001682E1B5|nr:hypothetical protein [Trichocoleus sp. FACHB-69]MBD1934991.1 hypothetical protein [Trichocoleus sp. FACHB-69]
MIVSARHISRSDRILGKMDAISLPGSVMPEDAIYYLQLPGVLEPVPNWEY